MAAFQPARIGSLGELLVEFVCTERNGRNLRPAPYIGPFPSGAPGIFIDQAARVGGKTIFSGAVGDDAFGSVVLERLRGVGVSDALLTVVPGVPTGSAFVSYTSNGSRDFVFNIAHSAAAAFPRGKRAVEAFLEFGTDVFHISGSTLGSPDMAEAALVICRELHTAGVRLSFDPNVRKELLGNSGYLSAVRELMSLTTAFLPSDADADILFPGEDFETFAPRLLEAGAEYVVLKRGEQGCIGQSRGSESIVIDGHHVDVVDPTGAGDCFCAAFVTLIASGLPFCDTLVRANAAGALSVTKLGPMEGNSSLDEIEAFLSSEAER